jgi:hypothetical protein
MAAHFNVSKISHSMFFPSQEFSLLSQNIGCNLDANDSMYIAPVALKTSYLTLCSFLFSTYFFYLSLIKFSSLLLILSLN